VCDASARSNGETAPKKAPFRLEKAGAMEESDSHPQLITLTTINRYPLPRR